MKLGDVFWCALDNAKSRGEIQSVRLQAMARWNMRPPPGMDKFKWHTEVVQSEEVGRITPEETAARLQKIHRFSDDCRSDIVFSIKAAVVRDREARRAAARSGDKAR